LKRCRPGLETDNVAENVVKSAHSFSSLRQAALVLFLTLGASDIAADVATFTETVVSANDDDALTVVSDDKINTFWERIFYCCCCR
jgi:hypothetical protein